MCSETEDFAAVLLEPIIGAGGGIIPPEGYLQEIRSICDRHGLLLIADEIQCGFGRSGKMWAVNHWGVEPDIICLSKALGGGLPLGAVVASSEIADKFSLPVPSTFSGHPLACAAGLKTLEIIERERLWENAAKVGTLFQERFEELAERHSSIGDIRFKGLMGGVELVRNRETKEPAVKEARDGVAKLKEGGILVLAGGLSNSTFRVQPSLNITPEQVNTVVEAFDRVLATV
ncbi:MAG: aminotransferase class III-fold pyridoxal phosphate-dependent enzyme [Nitrososphaeria archaeon]|nr:aminotransferase class III-fold pyridoxal phosphate-dependent enzyme [Nitrososphaeria archaeon]NIQ32463.1 aminotransferase class III-fold pyridoxal phosphate-dependent enzyme [Nitrososphaeria archaeon]